MESVDTSGKALVEFWKWAVDKGEMNQNTGGAIQAACSQVLKSAEDNWEVVDARALNIEDICRRFQNKRSKDLKPASLTTYVNRFQQGVAMFLEHARDPSSWKPARRNRSARQERKNEPVDDIGIVGGSSMKLPSLVAAPPSSSSPLVEYPFPLREGRLAYLKLPVDLKAAEVKRLAAHLNTLAVDGDG